MAYINYYTPAGKTIKAKRIDTGKEYTFSGQGSFDTNQYQIISGQEYTSPNYLSAPSTQPSPPPSPPASPPPVQSTYQSAQIYNYDPNTGRKLSPGEIVFDKQTGKYIKQGMPFGSSVPNPNISSQQTSQSPTTQPIQPTGSNQYYNIGQQGTWKDITTGRTYSGPKLKQTDIAVDATGKPIYPSLPTTPTTPTTSTNPTTYIVQKDETLSSIANKTGIPLATLKSLNPQLERGRNFDLIYPGDIVRLSTGSAGAATPTNTNQYYNIGQQGTWKDVQTGRTYSGPKLKQTDIPVDSTGKPIYPGTPIIPSTQPTQSTYKAPTENQYRYEEETKEEEIIPPAIPPAMGKNTQVAVTSEETEEGETPVDINRKITDEITYLTNVKTLNDLKASLGIDTKTPTPPNLETSYSILRNQYGVDAIETQLNNLNKLIRDKEASLRQGLYAEEGRLAPMTLIGARQRELARQGQEELDALNRDKAVLVEEYNTKQNIISNLMALKKADYANAKEAYDTAFTQNLQLQELLISTQNTAQDNARANLTIMANLIKDAKSTTGTLPADFKLALNKLEMQVGIPTGTMEYFLNAKPEAELITHGTGTDANGDEFVYMVYKDPTTGAIKTSNVYTGGVKATGGAFKFTSSQTSKLLAIGLTNDDISALAEDIATMGIEEALGVQAGLTTAQKNGIRDILMGTTPQMPIEDILAQYKAEGYTREETEQQWNIENDYAPMPDSVVAAFDKVFGPKVPESVKKPWWKFWVD